MLNVPTNVVKLSANLVSRFLILYLRHGNWGLSDGMWLSSQWASWDNLIASPIFLRIIIMQVIYKVISPPFAFRRCCYVYFGKRGQDEKICRLLSGTLSFRLSRDGHLISKEFKRKWERCYLEKTFFSHPPPPQFFIYFFPLPPPPLVFIFSLLFLLDWILGHKMLLLVKWNLGDFRNAQLKYNEN